MLITTKLNKRRFNELFTHECKSATAKKAGNFPRREDA